MADEFSCWVALVGLPSINSKQQTGPGKSCLCNRFIRSKEDDYNEHHPSGISNQDFVGQVVNNDNFLYWGHARRVVDNFTCGFKIIEQTQFYDDANFKPFGSTESYVKRALKTKISTHGTKFQYIDYDHIAEQESDEGLERFPSEKTEKVVIATFIFVFDVSREDMDFVDQYNMAETFIKQAKIPLVVALSKYDSINCKHIDTIRNLARKVPVVEISAKENINVELVFHVAAKLAKYGSKSVLKMAMPTYEECYGNSEDKRQQISRLYNSLTEQSVVDKNVTWSEFRQFSKENKHFQNYCELYGTKKAKSNFDRHIRSLTIKWIEKRKNLYLKDLDIVYFRFIDSLDLSNFTNAIHFIRNHPDFNDYFVALSDEKSWKDSEKCYSSDKNRIRIPLDLLHEPEAMICFEQRICKLREEEEQANLAEEFEHSLSHASNIIPGLSLEDVLSAVDAKFTKLDRNKSLSIYNDHQLVISKQAEKQFEEMLLENTALFRSQLPGGVLKSDATTSLSNALKEDVRWKNFSCLGDKRDCILLQHLAVIVTGTRNLIELSSLQKSYKSMLLEKTLARKELSYSNKLCLDDYNFTAIMMSNDHTARKWAEYTKQEYPYVTVDGVAYNITVSFQDPELIEIPDDSPVHFIVGFYRTDDWESFRTITRSYDRLLNKTGYRGLPCLLVYLPTENPTVTSEEGSRFACRLNCELLSEDTFKETLKTSLSDTITLLQQRAEFVEAPSSSFNKTILNLTIRMLYDDDVCMKEITSALFKYQYSFVHPYQPGVYVIHALLSGTSVFIMVHLLHYLDKESYPEHGCILLCKDSRKASLENARYYMTENSLSRSLGLVVIQTAKSLPYTSDVLQTAKELDIKCITLEQEQGNRRVSLGQQTTAVDVMLRQVLQNSLQFVGCDLSCEEESCTDDEVYTSINDVSIKDASISRKKRSNTLERLTSPPPFNLHGSLPERFKQMSVSCNELREDVPVNHPWNSLPRSNKASLEKTLDKTSDKAPPIYSTVMKGNRRSSAPFEGFNSPKSPPVPARPGERHFSETSSEGLDNTEHSDKHNKSGGMVASFPDSPFKSKRMKKKPTDGEVEQKRLEKEKKRLEKEARRKRAKDHKLEKNRKLLASWDPKKKQSDISNIKSLKPDNYYKPEESCYFGHALDFIAPWGGVPYYISTCVEYLECHDLTIEGLYRKEGNKLQINVMEKTFEIAFSGSGGGGGLSQFNILEMDVSVHVVASSIKKFFKRLPTPLIPHEYHDLLLAAVEIRSLEESRNADHVTRSIAKVLEVVNSFEKQNKITVAYIIRHLYRISELQEYNKMSAANLAIIFWPTLLQPTQEVLINNEDRTKFSKMVEFLIHHADKLFGPELPNCPPPDDEDIYDSIFHQTPHTFHPDRPKTQAEYEYIKRPKTYFNQALRIGHVPSLVKQCLTFIENGKITTSLYVHTAREDLVDKFVCLYEAAYAVDEHRNLNFSKVLKKLTITRSVTDDSISTSTTDENSVSSLSGDLSTCDSRFGLFEEETMDRTILASVLKKYLSSLVIPLIPPHQHKQFLDILSVKGAGRLEKIKECIDSLKQSHKILLSRILKHLNLMKDKGVLQIDQVFAPILFYGSMLPSGVQGTTLSLGLQGTTLLSAVQGTTLLSAIEGSMLPSPDEDPVTCEVPGGVPITYTPNTERYEQALKILISNVNALSLEYNMSLYAPLYEILEQGEVSQHEYSSIPGYQYSIPGNQYSLPVLPEETRHYDTPDTATVIYSSISNTYEREPGGPRARTPSDPFYSEPRARAPSDPFYAEPQYAEPDDLSELYDEEVNTPNANTYVEFIPLPVSDRHQQDSVNLPNR